MDPNVGRCTSVLLLNCRSLCKLCTVVLLASTKRANKSVHVKIFSCSLYWESCTFRNWEPRRQRWNSPGRIDLYTGRKSYWRIFTRNDLNLHWRTYSVIRGEKTDPRSNSIDDRSAKRTIIPRSKTRGRYNLVALVRQWRFIARNIHVWEARLIKLFAGKFMSQRFTRGSR